MSKLSAEPAGFLNKASLLRQTGLVTVYRFDYA
jgi:hypothetical protein